MTVGTHTWSHKDLARTPYHKMFGPLVPNFMQTAAPYPYRWEGNEDPGIGAADAFEQAVLREGPDTVAAIIAEPVMGAGGVIVPPDTYFPRIREICDRHNILLIADEIITGFGRTGKWFAMGHWGVEPDLVSFAKGVTSAYLPLGGVIISKKVHQTMLEAPADQKFMHAATYSGHPACCAVGLRNVELMEEEKLVERSALMGRRLLAGLQSLSNLANVGDVRGLGMMCAVELVENKQTKAPAIGPRRQGRQGSTLPRPVHPAARRCRQPRHRRYDLHCAAADDAGRNPRSHRRYPAGFDRGCHEVRGERQ